MHPKLRPPDETYGIKNATMMPQGSTAGSQKKRIPDCENLECTRSGLDEQSQTLVQLLTYRLFYFGVCEPPSSVCNARYDAITQVLASINKILYTLV